MLVMLADIALDHDALCWLRLMFMMHEHDPDALCWLRPTADARDAHGSCSRPPVGC